MLELLDTEIEVTDDQLLSIAQDVIETQAAVYEDAKASYPTSVWNNPTDPLILKQKPAYHSYTVRNHSRMTGGITEALVGERLFKSTDIPNCFDGTIASNLINKIEQQENTDEETKARQETKLLTKKLLNEINLSTNEKKMLILGGYLHDQGKYLEPYLKDMKKSQNANCYTLSFSDTGKIQKIQNPYFTKLEQQGLPLIINDIQAKNSILHDVEIGASVNIDHTQDLLSIYYYRTLLDKGLLTQKEEEFLEKSHSYFTWISQKRYSSAEETISLISQIFNIKEEKLFFCISLILTVADELGKGIAFSTPSPDNNRLQKLKNINQMLQYSISKTNE